MDKVKEKVERFRATAEILLKLDKPVFIKDARDDLYFADILLVGENSIEVECFGPKQRKGSKILIYWPLIVDLKKYQMEGTKR